MGNAAPPAIPDDAVLLARAFLNRAAEPGCVALWAFVVAVGPVEAANAIRRGSAPPSVLSATQGRRGQIDPAADIDIAQRHDVRLVAPESHDWPDFALGALVRTGAARVAESDGGRRVREAGELIPPLALWVKGCGELAGLGIRSAAIVGSRAATGYGERVTADLAYGLAGHGVEIVSGGAYGIDAAAHRAAITAAGVTVIVSAGGLDRPYPSGNATLFERAAERGLLISESPPGSAPHRHRFLTRNRLIAALSTGTVVVEAALRSGAANTAAHAAALGRPVMAVPGPVTSQMSAGCHALLRRERDPALLVTSVDDVLAVVGAAGDGLSPPQPGPLAPSDPRAELDGLDQAARRVFDGIPARRPARPDEIAMRCGLSTVEVIRALPALDLAGLLDTCDDGYRIARRLRRSGTPGRR